MENPDELILPSSFQENSIRFDCWFSLYWILIFISDIGLLFMGCGGSEFLLQPFLTSRALPGGFEEEH